MGPGEDRPARADALDSTYFLFCTVLGDRGLSGSCLGSKGRAPGGPFGWLRWSG